MKLFLVTYTTCSGPGHTVNNDALIEAMTADDAVSIFGLWSDEREHVLEVAELIDVPESEVTVGGAA